MTPKTKKSQHKCFKLQRIAIVNCHYAVSKVQMNKILNLTEKQRNEYATKFLKKYNLDIKQLNMNSMSYYFEPNDIIPMELPEENIHLNYVTCKIMHPPPKK